MYLRGRVLSLNRIRPFPSNLPLKDKKRFFPIKKLKKLKPISDCRGKIRAYQLLHNRQHIIRYSKEINNPAYSFLSNKQTPMHNVHTWPYRFFGPGHLNHPRHFLPYPLSQFLGYILFRGSCLALSHGFPRASSSLFPSFSLFLPSLVSCSLSLSL